MRIPDSFPPRRQRGSKDWRPPGHSPPERSEDSEARRTGTPQDTAPPSAARTVRLAGPAAPRTQPPENLSDSPERTHSRSRVK